MTLLRHLLQQNGSRDSREMTDLTTNPQLMVDWFDVRAEQTRVADNVIANHIIRELLQKKNAKLWSTVLFCCIGFAVSLCHLRDRGADDYHGCCNIKTKGFLLPQPCSWHAIFMTMILEMTLLDCVKSWIFFHVTRHAHIVLQKQCSVNGVKLADGQM